MCRDGSVGLATRYGLDGSGIESRWARYTAHVQPGPVTHPASCTMFFFCFFVCDTRADFVSLQVCHRKIKRNYPGNECFRQGENLFTRKIFGASGYISDSKRNAEGLLTTADNGEHTERSIKYSQSDNYVKI